VFGEIDAMTRQFDNPRAVVILSGCGYRANKNGPTTSRASTRAS
jgi:hypothetical protein